MIDPVIKDLAKGANFGAISTLMPDGVPSTQLMWVDCDDEHLLVNTETGRQKHKNVTRDPKVCVAVWDQENPYRYAEVRGEVVDMIGGKEARDHIDSLSMKYTGQPYYDQMITTERIILKIRPIRQRMGV